MNDLSGTSDPQVTAQTPAPDPQQDDTMSAPVSSGNKEVVGGPSESEVMHDSTGAEFELPKEVSSAGVRIQPTAIPIPPKVAQMGVAPAGQNVPVQTKSSVVLPLSDAQIAAGLHAGITDSIRWLAVWCSRRLKHFHIALKNIQGSLVRVQE
jgi:hypothetical protein